MAAELLSMRQASNVSVMYTPTFCWVVWTSTAVSNGSVCCTPTLLPSGIRSASASLWLKLELCPPYATPTVTQFPRPKTAPLYESCAVKPQSWVVVFETARERNHRERPQQRKTPAWPATTWRSFLDVDAYRLSLVIFEPCSLTPAMSPFWPKTNP